jgi:chemotaxis protein histidine kinase CheA
MMQDIDEGIFNDNVRAAREALKHLNCNDKLWYSDKCKELKLHRMKRLGIKNQNEFKLVFNQCDLPPPYDDAKEMKRWKKHQRMLNDCAVFREAHYQQCVKEAEDTPHRNARVKLDEYAVACNKAARELRLQESRDSTPKVKDMTNVSSKEFMHDPEAQRSLDEARQLSERRKLEKQERERLEEELAVRQQAEAEEKAKRDEHERLQRAAEKEANRLIEEERERKAKAARAKEKKKAKAKRYAKNKANTKAESETKRANDEAKEKEEEKKLKELSEDKEGFDATHISFETTLAQLLKIEEALVSKNPVKIDFMDQHRNVLKSRSSTQLLEYVNFTNTFDESFLRRSIQLSMIVSIIFKIASLSDEIPDFGILHPKNPYGKNFSFRNAMFDLITVLTNDISKTELLSIMIKQLTRVTEKEKRTPWNFEVELFEAVISTTPINEIYKLQNILFEDFYEANVTDDILMFCKDWMLLRMEFVYLRVEADEIKNTMIEDYQGVKDHNARLFKLKLKCDKEIRKNRSIDLSQHRKQQNRIEKSLVYEVCDYIENVSIDDEKTDYYKNNYLPPFSAIYKKSTDEVKVIIQEMCKVRT